MRRTAYLAGALALTVALVASAAAVWSWRTRPSADDSPPPSLTAAPVTPIEIPASSTGGVESLRAKTRAGEDAHRVEVVEERLAPALAELRGLLEGRADTPVSVIANPVEATAFTIEPDHESTDVLIERPGLSCRRARPAVAQRMGAEELAARLRAIGGAWRAVDRTEIKVIGIDPDAPGGPRCEVIFRVAGVARGDERAEIHGEATLEWTATAPARLRAWRSRRLTETRLARPPFVDVTAAAIGSLPAWRDHLSRSIDAFRERIDAASGIDVYGHHGLAVGDLDGDGAEDLYVATAPGLPNVLLRHRGDGTFEDRSAETGLDILDGTSQALILDLDEDGDQDVFLVIDGGLVLLRNDGSGRFRRDVDALPALAAGDATPIGAAAADYDLDGDIDLYVASYVFWRGNTGRAGTRMPTPYHEAHNGAANLLLRNRGDGTFEDRTQASGLDAGNRRFSFAAAWADADADGDPDLYVANDFGSNDFYRNLGDGRFVLATDEAGVSDVGAGMSVAWEDYDNDGDLDLYVGNMFSAAGRRITGVDDYLADDRSLRSIYRRHARGNSLFRNRGDGTFDDVTSETDAGFGRWAWASDFIDFDLDGREDIYVQNGFLTNPRTLDL